MTAKLIIILMLFAASTATSQKVGSQTNSPVTLIKPNHITDFYNTFKGAARVAVSGDLILYAPSITVDTVVASGVSVRQLGGYPNPSKVLYVSPSYAGKTDGSHFATIDDAVAAVGDSSTILIGAGTYDFKQITFAPLGSSGWTQETRRKHVTILGSGRSTILRPAWGGHPYQPSIYGYQKFYIDSCENVEIGNFSYDNLGDVITETDSTALQFANIKNSKGIYIHDIYAFNGGDIQEKSGFLGIYNCRELTITNNYVKGFDVAVMIRQIDITDPTMSTSIVTGNTIIGGTSEGIIFYSSYNSPAEETGASTNPRGVVIANNYIYDKATYAINVKLSFGASVSIIGNTIGRTNEYPTYTGGGIALDSCSDVTIFGNSYSGTSSFLYVNHFAKDVSVTSNAMQYACSGSFIFDAQSNATQELDRWTVANNTIIGARSAPAWNATRTYPIGEVVSVGTQLAYLCRVKNTNEAVTDTTYWTPVLTYYDAIWGWFKNSTIEGNTISGAMRYPINFDKHPTNVKVLNNTITGGKYGIGVTLTPTDTSGLANVENLQINGNTISTTDSGGGGYAIAIAAYKMSNSTINNNYLTCTVPTYYNFQNDARILENVTVENNTIDGKGAVIAFREPGGSKKRNNVIINSGTWSTSDTSRGGYVRLGETFYATQPTTYMGWICTVAGYGTKGTYVNGTSYVLGDYVTGSNGSVYRCILAHTGASGDAPITGGTYSTYWVLAGTKWAYRPFGKVTNGSDYAFGPDFTNVEFQGPELVVNGNFTTPAGSDSCASTSGHWQLPCPGTTWTLGSLGHAHWDNSASNQSLVQQFGVSFFNPNYKYRLQFVISNCTDSVYMYTSTGAGVQYIVEGDGVGHWYKNGHYTIDFTNNGGYDIGWLAQTHVGVNGAFDLDSVSIVCLSNPANNNIAYFDSTAGKWKARDSLVTRVITTSSNIISGGFVTSDSSSGSVTFGTGDSIKVTRIGVTTTSRIVATYSDSTALTDIPIWIRKYADSFTLFGTSGKAADYWIGKK